MHVVVHYAEVGLKGRNRPRFERRLRENLRRSLLPLGDVRVSPRFGRILIELPPGTNFEDVKERINHVFGVALFSRATVTEPQIEAIERAVDDFVDGQEFQSFGVRARRPEKAARFTSADLARHLGARVVARTGAKVDLSNPELWIEVHVMAREAILLHRKIPGPGGMPAGSAGSAVSLISGGIDSPVASYEIMKRGCELRFVHFHSSPFTSDASLEKVREVVARLALRQGTTHLWMVPFGELQQKLVREAPAEPRIVLYRRFMFRLAEAIAEREGALALVTGESLGQVSSQTLANLDTINRVVTVPVLRPLIGVDKGDIVDRAKAIGTYEISIEPDEDCCSYLMPRRPATWTRPGPIEAIEQKLDVQDMVQAALANAEREDVEPEK